MTKKIYHGSDHIIERPQYGVGKKNNDYGLGFYCTGELDMAKEWAVDFERDGYANCYEIDCSTLKILDLNDEQYCILHFKDTKRVDLKISHHRKRNLLLCGD